MSRLLSSAEAVTTVTVAAADTGERAMNAISCRCRASLALLSCSEDVIADDVITHGRI